MNRPKGTKDNYGLTQEIRSFLRQTLEDVALLYNFKEIETPIFESKEVFVRSVGETSDIVSKEMYVFKDKGDREMVLRPEGTAGTIRAIVENKLYANPLPLKVFYQGPMFRYENPQKGRQRQFTQFGVEMIGDKNPFADAEVISMAATILDAFKIKYILKINSLGTKETRDSYSKALKEYFNKYKDQLTEDSINRIEKNPMRILDDKIDGAKDFVKAAPRIDQFYSEEVKKYFDQLIGAIKELGIDYEIDTTLVRGLDYYTDTAFEFVSNSGEAGSQSTLIGGGRYENLIKDFGGPDLGGIGFGLGMERIVNELEAILTEEEMNTYPSVFVLNIAEEYQAKTLGIVVNLRQNGIQTEWNQKPTKLQKAFEKASASKATISVIAGAKELSENKVMVKMDGKQEEVKIDELAHHIEHLLGGCNEEH